MVDMLAELGTDPFALFSRWYDEAVAQGAPMPEAMVLATSDRSGRPAARVVLLKGIEGGELRFFTNLNSRKARQMGENPRASALFYWPVLGRQVRFDGEVSLLPAEDNDAYFRTRPRESQIGAWASPQSEPVASREELERAVQEVEHRFAGREVSRPPHWGGYRMRPTLIEFWINRVARLHDRFEFQRQDDRWHVVRLGP